MDRTASYAERARRRHAPLLSGCALALALAAAPHAARAQDADKGFQGSHTVNAGNAEVFGGGTGSKFTQIDVTAPQTVLTWTPDDPATNGTIDFLPEGYTAAFTSSSLGDYTVLNRILPGGTATIGINGTITSSVSNGDGQSPGGNVWFYTPNGFVVGPKAVIQVGGLVMTTNDITYSIDPMSGNANFYDPNGAINFRGPDGSKGSIVNNGTIISGSYIALVAPRIVQSGYVSADRQIGYIAAEQVDLKINAGNFDFVIGQGTTDANGVVHTGVTTGSAGVGYFDPKRIQIVAVPKNTALTMLLSGSIGYTPAESADYDGTGITLTAGGEGAPEGSILIGEADFRNDLTGDATGDITVAPPAPGVNSEGTPTALFEKTATLSADKSINLTAAAGTAITTLDYVALYAQHDTQGGAIKLEALGGGGLTPAGQITIASSVIANAAGFGLTSDDGTTGFDGHGGSIAVLANGGHIDVGDLSLTANGFGGDGTLQGGNGFGGSVDIASGFGGSITSGAAFIRAQGDGGASYDYSGDVTAGGKGGVGRGGSIAVADSLGDAATDPSGGQLSLGSFVRLDASAVGGNSAIFGAGLGGDAFGGDVKVTIDRQDQSMGSFRADARASDGDGAFDPVGGAISMTIGGGKTLTLDSLTLDAGVLASVNGPAGALGTGGTIDLTIDGGGALNVLGDTRLLSTAEVSSFTSDIQTSPDLTGGTVSLLADKGSFTTNNLEIDVSANNVGAASSAGFAQGGVATVTASNGGSIRTEAQFSDCTECSPGGFFEVDAEGYGTGGGSANVVAGGNITLSAQSGGSIAAGSGTIDLYAGAENGISGSGQATGVTAQGGTIAIDAIGGTIGTGIYADASGYGGDAENLAGSGTGGAIDVRVLGGTLVDSLYAQAGGSGGFTYVEGDGGDGTGGRFTLTSDADATFTNFGLVFYGQGRGGSTYLGTGGDGTGGSAQVDVIGGTHTWYQAYLDGTGYGATSYGEGSLAGSGHGSAEGLDFHLGGGADLALSYLYLDASGFAASGGGANEATGGSASLLVDQLASLTADSIGINASGSLAFEERSADTFDSTPNAHGGNASAVANTGTITTPFLEVVANGMTGGALTSAGTAVGGTATVGASDGGLIDIVDGGGEVLTEALSSGFSGLVVEAQGLGAEGPSAADATGGTATLYTEGGAISSVSDIVVNADANAGSFAGAFAYSGTAANGFNATGGTATVEMRAGGSGGGAIDAPSLIVNARGLPNGDDFNYPPVQGNGGIGTGGTAMLAVAQGALTTGDIVVNADGIGGSSAENAAGGAAFQSGAGAGGTGTFAISGGSVTTTGISVTAQGIGASGQGESEGTTPSLAAAGTGGTAQFVASGGSLSDSGSVSIQAVGFGGEGAFNPNGGPGGNGGDAFGGSALFSAPAGGSASLGIAGDIRIDASAFGGEASGSVTEQAGTGGNATGGDSAMALADIPFTLGPVQIYALAAPGAGAVTGDATGGSAGFSLIDSSSTANPPRTIDSLDLNAGSYAGAGAGSVGGSTAFTAQVGGAGSALAITNSLSAFAGGDTGPAGYGFAGAISGAPVTVGGSTSIITPSDAILAISGAGALDSAGDLSVLVGGTFTSTGAISTGGSALVSAGGGIDMTDLAAGSTTSLQSLGPVVVSHDLRSAGAVTVFGSSVNLVSLAGLTFADADATAGDLSIETEDDLLLATADATGAVTLTSNAGSIHNTGAVNGVGITYIAAGDVVSDTIVASGGALTVDAGGTFIAPGTVTAVGNVSLSADLGMALAGVVSGGTTLLQATGGALSVDSLTSPGLVTALGQSVRINSPGALSFASAQATAGDLDLTTAGNLALAQGGASGAVTLTSTGGSVSGAGPIVAGDDMSVSGDTGIALGALTSGGTSLLTSANGTVGVTNLNSAGLVTASGIAIGIGSSGALAFDKLDASAGNVSVQTAGTLTVDTVDATGSITLVSTGGALTATGSLIGNGVTLSSLASLQLASGVSTPGAISLTSTSGSVSSAGPVSAGGTLAVAGNSGVSLGSANSGGTTSLTSANGAIGVTDLASVGLVNTVGRSIDISSSGALNFADARATAGDLKLTTAGNLAVTQGSATGALSLTSTGGAVSSPGALVSGGNTAVAGRSGVSLDSVTSGGTTSLTSSNGSVRVGALISAGSLTAQAGAGDLTIDTASDLAVAQANATGNLRLTSLGGAITGTGPISSGGTSTIVGTNGVALISLNSGGNVLLTSQNGALSVANLNSSGVVTLARGRSVTIGSTGALSFADLQATAGDVAVQTAGYLTLGTVGATGSATLGSAGGAVTATGAVTAGGNLAVAGNSGVTLGTATSGGTSSLTSANGAIAVTDLRSTGAVTASGRSVTIGSTGALSFADLDATAGSIGVQTGGNLSLISADATGAISLASSTGAVAATGPVNAGGDASASGATGVTFAALTSGGTTTLTAANGAVGVTALTSVGAVTASGRSIDLRSPGSLTVGSADATAGNLTLQAAQALTVANASASGTAAITAGTSLSSTGQVNAAAIQLAGSTVAIGGQVRATGDLGINAAQLLTLSGLAAGRTIAVVTGDIAIGATGRLGSRGLTQSIALRNLSTTSPMNIGGTGQQGQFSLDKNEATRLFADQQITFIARGSEGVGGDVRVGDLALAFGDTANIGAGGLLKIDAGGLVEVNGAVALTTVSDNDGFSIDPSRIDVIAGSGSIAMRNAAGALQGVLELEAGTIAVADKPTLDKIASLTDFAAISSALDTPGPAGPAGGYLQAGTINLIAGNGLYIQNGGATTEYDDRRGFSANQLNIETASSSPQIAINGVIHTGLGDLFGQQTAKQVSINGAFAVTLPKTANVTINGCPASGCATLPEFSFTAPSSDDLELVVTTADDGKSGPAGQLVQVQDNQPLITPPMVDEPITGVGNDDLWQVKCTPEGAKSGCPAQGGEE